MEANFKQNLTMGQILSRAVENHPDNEAIIYVDRDFRMTYREFGQTVDRVARGLMALGIQKGEKVAIWSTNIPYWITMQFATAKIGAILLTINTNYKSAELDYILKQSETENIFVIDGYQDSDYVNIINELVPELKTNQRGYLNSSRYSHLKRVFFLGHEKHRGMYSIPEVKAMAAMTSEEAYQARQADLNPSDVVNMQYTSGTTGFPKGVMLSHENVVTNGFWIGENQNFTYKDRLCLTVPLFHCFGCVLAVIACVTHASTMVVLETFNPVNAMTSVEQEKCTAIYGVPTMFIAILDHKLFNKFDFRSLRTGIMAGSTCPIKVMEQVIEKMYMNEVTIVYGLTEASPGITQTRAHDDIKKRVETVGRPMQGIEVKMVSYETGNDAGIGETGEICCRGYNVMKGYYNMPEATAEAIDADGWLHSGDLGVMDEDGYIAITGRIKDMIIRGGENIYPREIEEFLYNMKEIKDVQVVGIPSRKYGEEVSAFVILKDGQEVAPEDIRDFCRGKISRFKIPKYVAIVDAFPMTASGKIQKYKFREKASLYFPELDN
ncbi:MAG: AMP-binding protein [Candidatus Desulfaltia sp.]|nr:AMP-binding protein [Candidatus Desulfaltia sp.]